MTSRATSSRPPSQPGGKAKLVITATPDAGWHVYAYSRIDPDKVGREQADADRAVAICGLDAIAREGIVPPKTKSSLVPGNSSLSFHDEPVTWTIELTAPADSPAGVMVISGYLGFQTCKDTQLPAAASRAVPSEPACGRCGRARGRFPWNLSS